MKAKIYDTLTTPFSQDMDKEHPWAEYPRPAFVRDSYFSLNGEWNFALCGEGDLPTEYTEKILVPFPPESALSGIERRIEKDKVLVYRRYFTLPDGFIKNRLIINFGAVDQETRVLINGNEAGRHEGGYLPFSFDITDLIKDGENEITVIAKDTLDKKYPYGKQKENRGGMWYTPVSGIWQSVWLESLPEDPILSIKIEQNSKFAKIRVNSEAEYKILKLHFDGSEYRFHGDEIIIEPKEPKNWTPESPFLYYFTLSTGTDTIESYFALRDIKIDTVGDTDRFLLNGKPYFFSGLLDQGYYPDGIFLPATPEGYESDILLAKRLGFNTLRKHIKIEPMIFYHLCDKLGMVVFQDMVNNSGYSFILDTALPTVGLKNLNFSFRHRDEETRRIFLDTMEDTAELLYNTPSVLLYTVFNEGWGEFDPDDAYERLKAIDPSRLIDATSGWFYGKKSDMRSLHIYFKTPKVRSTDGRAINLSEFGGFSLRVPEHLFGSKNYGYKIYDTRAELTEAIFELYTEGVAALCEDGLCASIYTQLSDVEDETNGLITYDRRVVKVDEGQMKLANEILYQEFDNAIKNS